jgi:hypothetical protein
MNAELFQAIECANLSAQVNVVSGYNQFVRALVAQPEVQMLLGAVRSQEDAAELLLRVLNTLRVPHDPAYENPHDVALAAYLWVLSKTDPKLAHEAASQVLACPGCWWAHKLAENLLAATTAEPDSRSEQPSPNGEALPVS